MAKEHGTRETSGERFGALDSASCRKGGIDVGIPLGATVDDVEDVEQSPARRKRLLQLLGRRIILILLDSSSAMASANVTLSDY